MELQTYGKNKPPRIEKVRADILNVLNRRIKGELPILRATDLRRRVCSKVKAPSFFPLLKKMQEDELIMISGVDETWAQCALWDHPKMVAWRIERAKWAKELEEIEKRQAEERRQWEIENAPRLAAERLQRELAEFFLDNSDQLFDVLRNIMRAYMPNAGRIRHSDGLSAETNKQERICRSRQNIIKRMRKQPV